MPTLFVFSSESTSSLPNSRRFKENSIKLERTRLLKAITPSPGFSPFSTLDHLNNPPLTPSPPHSTHINIPILSRTVNNSTQSNPNAFNSLHQRHLFLRRSKPNSTNIPPLTLPPEPTLFPLPPLPLRSHSTLPSSPQLRLPSVIALSSGGLSRNRRDLRRCSDWSGGI
jgi:hypothetical protein